MSYQEQLEAIQNLLADPSFEMQQDGYDLMFDLWRTNVDDLALPNNICRVIQVNSNFYSEMNIRLQKFIDKNIAANDSIQEQYNEFIKKLRDSSTITHNNENEIGQPTIPSQELSPTQDSYWEKPARLTGMAFLLIAGLVFLIWQIPKQGYTLLDIAISAIYLIGFIELVYILPKKECVVLIEKPNIKLSYNAPNYLFLLDENVIDISVENRQSNEVKGTIALRFMDSDSSTVKSIPGEKLSKDLVLDGQNKETIRFKFQLVNKALNSHLNFKIRILITNQIGYSIQDKFSIIPILYVRTAINWLFITIGTFIVAMLSDRIKDLFFP